MTTARPWYPRYVPDYRNDTQHLTTLEHGAYTLLIDEYWVKGGLPIDDNRLAIIAKVDLETWKQCIKHMLKPFFDDDWKHKRIDKELKIASKTSDLTHKRAKKAALKRWEHKRKQKMPQALPQALHEGVPQGMLVDTTLHTSHIKKDRVLKDSCRKRVSTTEIRDSAKRFYQAYPKHIAPRDAEKKFSTLVASGVDPEHIIAAATRYAEAHRAAGTEKQFIPAPSVWLNRGSYDDEDLPICPRAPIQRSNGTRGLVGLIMADILAEEDHGEHHETGDGSGCEETDVVDVKGLSYVRG